MNHSVYATFRCDYRLLVGQATRLQSNHDAGLRTYIQASGFFPGRPRVRCNHAERYTALSGAPGGPLQGVQAHGARCLDTSVQFVDLSRAELNTPHIIRGKVKQPKFIKRTIDALSEDQVRAILAAALYARPYTTVSGRQVTPARATADRDRAIVLTLVDSGLRASELCALVIDDYDAKRGRLLVQRGKGDKARYVVVGARTQKAIWRYLTLRPNARASEPLFATRNGAHIDRTTLRQLLARMGNRAGVAGVHPHRFRHTFAINFLRNGGNLLTLKELLGHESLVMVQRYARIVEADIDRAHAHSPADKWRL